MRRRRGVGPRRQPRARPVQRAAREGSARSDSGRWTGVLPAGSIGSSPRAPLSPGRHVRPGPSPPGGYLLLAFAHQLTLFRALASDRGRPWGYTTLLRPLPHSSALLWTVGINKSCFRTSPPPTLGCRLTTCFPRSGRGTRLKLLTCPGSFPFQPFEPSCFFIFNICLTSLYTPLSPKSEVSVRILEAK